MNWSNLVNDLIVISAPALIIVGILYLVKLRIKYKAEKKYQELKNKKKGF